jgi:hypothetical protein
MSRLKGLYWPAICVLLLALLPSRSAHSAADVADPFRDYYEQHQGMRVLGSPLTALTEHGGYPAQYFEKGRLEDHHGEVSDPRWVLMYGRLTEELMERSPNDAVSATSVTYAELRRQASPASRRAPPAGFKGGTQALSDGVFVPYDSLLRPAPGAVVPRYFWSYINRADLFPGGWLHDIGLPMTAAISVRASKNGQQRDIVIQAFERAVLTLDPKNPPAWQVERGNLGSDLVRTLGVSPSIEVPPPFARATLPLHILARLGAPGGQVVVRLRWQDGTELLRLFPVLHGEDGQGLVIGNLNWMNEGPPPMPPTQPAALEVLSASGELMARQPLTALNANDPATQMITLYWVLGETLQPVRQRIPQTSRVGAAAIQELLWGPGPPNLAGFSTAIPTPEQVLAYPGRGAGWGPRVTLRKLTIQGGVATVDFSRELAAYGGGSLRVMLLRQQIARTLLQFPSVREVRIAIEGQTEAVMEP